jgi:hypothetical protein
VEEIATVEFARKAFMTQIVENVYRVLYAPNVRGTYPHCKPRADPNGFYRMPGQAPSSTPASKKANRKRVAKVSKPMGLNQRLQVVLQNVHRDFLVVTVGH